MDTRLLCLRSEHNTFLANKVDHHIFGVYYRRSRYSGTIIERIDNRLLMLMIASSSENEHAASALQLLREIGASHLSTVRKLSAKGFTPLRELPAMISDLSHCQMPGDLFVKSHFLLYSRCAQGKPGAKSLRRNQIADLSPIVRPHQISLSLVLPL